MGLDYGFFEALTGPMKAAGQIQANRDTIALQRAQQEQQIKNLQLQELNRNQAQQKMLNASTDAALGDLYTKNKFARQKDVDDFRNWHNDLSGWVDIQEVLRQHGSIDNARLNGNLDYLLEEYKAKLKDNPISRRTNKNKASLELFHSYSLDKDKNGKLITSGSRNRYQQFVDGETDNFIFNGARGDYLDEATKARNIGDNVNVDDVIADNYNAIIIDMINDQNPADAQAYMQGLNDQDIRNWVSKELNYTEDGGIGYFGDKAIYGEQEIDTEFSTELVRSLDAVNNTRVYKGSDYFKFKDGGLSFKENFDANVAQDWDRLGGYDKGSEMKNYKGMRAMFAKGRQMVGSGRIFANNPDLESAITDSWAGHYGNEDKTSRYNPKNRQVNDISMLGLYDSRGHKIQDQDIGSYWVTGAGSWQESETDDLRMRGYHIALEGKNADGDSFLLTDVSNEKDMNKMREQYKDTVFDYVIVAELIDDDAVSHDDAYYKKVNLGDASVQALLNKAVDSEDLNNVKTQMITYEQQAQHRAHAVRRKEANASKLQKQLQLPDSASVDQVVNAYDQTMTIGLGMANVPSRKIQQAMPMIISDLYVDSQQKREYPFDMTPQEKDPRKKTIANNASEYMAHSAQKLKYALINNDPSFAGMLEAIKTGDYDTYSQSILNKNIYKTGRNISKSISKYQN